MSQESSQTTISSGYQVCPTALAGDAAKKRGACAG
jgi:hypothetical protein